MAMLDLQQEFKNVLHNEVPKRADLVKKLAAILNMEMESVSRRLSGRVQFSINEMAKIASVLHISLDRLLVPNKNYSWVPLRLEAPMKVDSIDVLSDSINFTISEAIKIIGKPSEFEYFFNNLPLEFAFRHRHLLKFMYFKWGHLFVSSDGFTDYDSWEITPDLMKLESKYKMFVERSTQYTYIWDHSLIWNLVKEVEYFRNMNIINHEHKSLILKDLHDVLYEVENMNKYFGEEGGGRYKRYFYICHVTVGVSCWYYISERGSLAYSITNFSSTSLLNNPDTCLKIKEWMNSLKKLSTLISGTGNIVRRIFFEEQHDMVEYYKQHN